ncbi:MAG: hypothetical protein ACKVII_16570 [Planctomycetales bacterium]
MRIVHPAAAGFELAQFRVAKRRQTPSLLPPLRGSIVRSDPFPWVYTHGYLLSPLRG